MKIISIKIMRGPNQFSVNRKNLVVMKLDLEELENKPTNKIPGFAERLEKLIPSMQKHHCSEGRAGGFFSRVREGTWMGHVIEHIALELQTLAGMDCGFGRTFTTDQKGIYDVIICYQLESAGVYATRAALDVAQALIKGEEYDLEEDIKNLAAIKREQGFGPTTQAIIDEAVRRNIPYRRLDEQSFILFGHGKNQRFIKASMSSETSSIGVDLAGDKEDTKKILSKGFIPVPEWQVVRTEEEALKAMEKISFPLVCKPINGNHGRGVTTNINKQEDILKAFQLAQEFSRSVIIERFMEGYDFRFLVINYKLVAVGNRIPAMVTGDGERTIEQLVEIVNQDPRRGEHHENILTKIKIDDGAMATLKKNGMTPQSVPQKGEIVYLKDTANMSTGGTCIDVTDKVHPLNKAMAERITRLMHLDICGIDIIAKDVSVPFTPENCAVLEVNAAPGFRMHLAPSSGTPRNVAKPVLDMLYPGGSPSRIPLVAVTGTNGKTTTVRLIAHIAKQAGYKTGFTNTDGIYIDGNPIFFGDCSGPSSAAVVLNDPLVDFAVLECARGGIIRNGLGFDYCNIGVITNISEDHLGLEGINNIKELAQVKEVVVQSVFKEGYAVLNADDDVVYKMRRNLDCHIALFSFKENNERILDHIREGGLACFPDEGFLAVSRNGIKTRLVRFSEIPLTAGGTAEFNCKNILAATTAAVAQGIDVNRITKALLSFNPSPENTPGRMNIFDFADFKVMVDYAHNPGGFAELEILLKNTESSNKVGIIAAPGDRRDGDIRTLGKFAGRMFDEVIIRHDSDGRGRTNEELTRLLSEGVWLSDPDKKVTVISQESEALRYAIDTAKKDSFIVVCTDKVRACLDFVEQERKNYLESISNKVIGQH